MASGRWLILLKIAVFAMLVYVVLNGADIEKLCNTLKQFNYRVLFLIPIIWIGGIFQSLRFKLFLKRYGGTILDAIRLCFSGLFFSQFLPSSVGGDVYKWAYISKRTGSKKDAFQIVIADRVLGVQALLILSCLFIPFYAARICNNGLATLISLAAIGGMSCSFLIYLVRYIPKTILNIKFLKPIFGFAIDVANQMKAIPFFKALTYSVLTAIFMNVMIIYSLFSFIGESINVTYAIAVVPIIMLINSLPISFNGWGTREAMFALMFGSIYGVNIEACLAVSVVFGGLILVSSSIGGIMWTVNREFSDKASQQ